MSERANDDDNPYQAPRAAAQQPGKTLYHAVPFYRRSAVCSSLQSGSIVVMLSSCCTARWLDGFWSGTYVHLMAAFAVGVIGSVGLVTVCVVVLTGPVYFKQLDRDGRLVRWGPVNRVAAVLVLLLFLALYAYFVVQLLGRI